MVRSALNGGVTAAGRRRIRFDFTFHGVRYRPTLIRIPSETNLRLAREHLAGIKHRIAASTFSFADATKNGDDRSPAFFIADAPGLDFLDQDAR